MRQLRKNRQVLYYSLYMGEIPIYAYTEKELTAESGESMLTQDGHNIISDCPLTTGVDGEPYYVIDSTKDRYSTPVKFKANISFDSGETKMAEYGLNPSDYNAIISADKGKLPFDERTLIWFESELEFDKEGNIKPESADYRVIAIRTSLNEQRFILKKRVDD